MLRERMDHQSVSARKRPSPTALAEVSSRETKGSISHPPDSLAVSCDGTSTQIDALGTERLREDLTQMLVHDLRSRLAVMLASLELMSDEAAKAGHKMTAHLNRARTSAYTMLAMVDAILDVPRLETGILKPDLRPVYLDQLTTRCIADIAPLAQQCQLHITLAVSERLPLAFVDEELIGRVLMNLLGNAMRFSPREGTITINLRYRDQALGVSIHDQGPGIPLAEQGQLFEKYVQASNKRRGGSGLGLTFCKLAVEAHGGLIWVHSIPGQGATFCLTLPLRESSTSSISQRH